MGEGEGGGWSYSGGQRQWTRLSIVADTTPAVDKVADGRANEGSGHGFCFHLYFLSIWGPRARGVRVTTLVSSIEPTCPIEPKFEINPI